MTGFRIGPLDASSKHKGTYLVGLKEEGKTIENKNFREETVFVKKVSACKLIRKDKGWVRWRFQDPRRVPQKQTTEETA
jgi:hypothetical protein